MRSNLLTRVINFTDKILSTRLPSKMLRINTIYAVSARSAGRNFTTTFTLLKDGKNTYDLQSDFAETAKKVSETVSLTMDATKDKTYDFINKAKGGINKSIYSLFVGIHFAKESVHDAKEAVESSTGKASESICEINIFNPRFERREGQDDGERVKRGCFSIGNRKESR